MKVYYHLVLLAAIVLFTTSCSGKYDNAITNYIQTVDGQKVDMDVKIGETKELKKVTVGDSITYINQKAEQTLKTQVQEVEKQLFAYQEDLVKANTGKSAKVIVEAYTTQIVKTQQMIDSLKAIKPEPTRLYDDKKTDQVLAVVVECKYSVLDGATRNRVDILKNFILSPDGKVCFGETDNPDMLIEK